MKLAIGILIGILLVASAHRLRGNDKHNSHEKTNHNHKQKAQQHHPLHGAQHPPQHKQEPHKQEQHKQVTKAKGHKEMMSANLVSHLGEESGQTLIMDGGIRSAELDIGSDRVIHPHEEYLASSYVPESVKLFPMTPESSTNIQEALGSSAASVAPEQGVAIDQVPAATDANFGILSAELDEVIVDNHDVSVVFDGLVPPSEQQVFQVQPTETVTQTAPVVEAAPQEPVHIKEAVMESVPKPHKEKAAPKKATHQNAKVVSIPILKNFVQMKQTEEVQIVNEIQISVADDGSTSQHSHHHEHKNHNIESEFGLIDDKAETFVPPPVEQLENMHFESVATVANYIHKPDEIVPISEASLQYLVENNIHNEAKEHLEETQSSNVFPEPVSFIQTSQADSYEQEYGHVVDQAETFVPPPVEELENKHFDSVATVANYNHSPDEMVPISHESLEILEQNGIHNEAKEHLKLVTENKYNVAFVQVAQITPDLPTQINADAMPVPQTNEQQASAPVPQVDSNETPAWPTQGQLNDMPQTGLSLNQQVAPLDQDPSNVAPEMSATSEIPPLPTAQESQASSEVPPLPTASEIPPLPTASSEIPPLPTASDAPASSEIPPLPTASEAQPNDAPAQDSQQPQSNVDSQIPISNKEVEQAEQLPEIVPTIANGVDMEQEKQANNLDLTSAEKVLEQNTILETAAQDYAYPTESLISTGITQQSMVSLNIEGQDGIFEVLDNKELKYVDYEGKDFKVDPLETELDPSRPIILNAGHQE